MKNNPSSLLKILFVFDYIIVIGFVQFISILWIRENYPCCSFKIMWLFLIIFWILNMWLIFLVIIIKRMFYLFLLMFAVLTFIVTIRLLFVPLGPGFFGYDANVEFVNFWKLLEHGHAQTAEYLPGMYFLAAGISIISNINPWQVARFGPIFWSLLSPLLLVLIVKRQFFKFYTITSTYIVGILSMILYINTYTFIMFHNIFHRESMAFIMMFTIIYLMVSLQNTSKKILIPLSIAEATLVITHHLTPVMLLGFMVLVAGITKNSKYLRVLLMLFVFLFAYWTFEYKLIWSIQYYLLRDISLPTTVSTSVIAPSSSRYLLLIYGQSVFFGIFLMISLVSWYYFISLNKKLLAKWSTIWLIWLIINYGLIFLSTFGILIPVKGVAFSTRFQLYAKLSITVLISGLILLIRENKILNNDNIKSTMFIWVLLILIFSNILFNYYRIHPSLYAPYSFIQNEPRPKIYTHELVACSWLHEVPADYDPALRGPLELWHRMETRKWSTFITNHYMGGLYTKYYPPSLAIKINQAWIYSSKSLLITLDTKDTNKKVQ